MDDFFSPIVPLNPKTKIDLDEKIRHSKDLILPKYSLPYINTMAAIMKITLINDENDSKQYNSNYYMVYIEINFHTFECILF